MTNTPSKNDTAWEELFKKYDILDHIECDGQFEISSKQINEFREARLMTKFDHKINLPSLFSRNDLAVLPVTRGDYIIARFDAYHQLEEPNHQIITVSPPENIQSLNYNNITSEAVALNAAYASGIIADFLEDNSIIATISGRMTTGAFDFRIRDTGNNIMLPLSVTNAQIEIDSSYEGRSCMAVIEAKLDLSEDFMTRQLYYPFRVWQKRITKPIRPVFFTYSNNIFRLYEYSFDDIYNYSSIRLIRQKNYSVEETSITLQEVQDILHTTALTQEPEGIPFPQADSFDRVINLCELLYDHDMSKSDITEQYAFNERQADYYANAARYIGLVEKLQTSEEALYVLSTEGRNILNMNYKNRQLNLCRNILSHRAFNKVLDTYFSKGYMPSSNEIIDIMRRSELYNVKSEETLKRRTSTIKSWLKWIIDLIKEC